MNIIVCIKQVPSSNEVRIDKNTNTIIREKSESVINPFDLHALEEALRLKQRYGGRVTVISMGIAATESLLRECAAAGADDTILLNDRAFAGSDSLTTAYILALGIKKTGDFDLIICGKQATDGDTAQVGPELAEKLGVPHISYVNKINGIDKGHMTCSRQTDEGHDIISAALPALITVVREINEPRLPTLSGVMRAGNHEIKIWGADYIEADRLKCGLKGSPTRVVKTYVPVHTSECEFITGSTSDQVKKLTDILSGEAGL
jgi:electron transfer flavoprotein beta subunit